MFEVLIGNEHAVKWVGASKNLNVERLGARPVEAGRDGDGSDLFISRVRHRGDVIPGKASANVEGANIAYHGKEKRVEVCPLQKFLAATVCS